MKRTAKAYTNIALIKYWGKRDEKWMIPSNSSLSVTLDQFYTETTVEFSKEYTEDIVFLNNEIQEGKIRDRVLSFLNIVRAMADSELHAKVVSINHVPTEAGLASSASAYAALAKASSDALGLSLDSISLSRLARRGSGSASRSIYGGFVVWHAGENDITSYADEIEMERWENFRLVAFIASSQKKKVDSRQAMAHTKETSPYFETCVEWAEKSIDPMIKALRRHDIDEVGKLAETSAMRMHASLLAAQPPQWYFNETSIQLMNMVREAQEAGLAVYFTMDGGPNVKVICLEEDVERLLQFARASNIDSEAVVCKPGQGVERCDYDLF